MEIKRLVLASTSKVKLDACKLAFPKAAIEQVAAPSGIDEQPFGDATQTGAINRLNAARKAVSDAEIYVAIESGIFLHADRYEDVAVVAAAVKDDQPTIFHSMAVAFPAEIVKDVIPRAASWTVGAEMFKRGLVADASDPHMSLCGRARASFMAGPVTEAVEMAVRNHGKPQKADEGLHGAIRKEVYSRFVTRYFYANGSSVLDCPSSGGMIHVSAPNPFGGFWEKDTRRSAGCCQQYQTSPGTCITRKKTRWILRCDPAKGYYWDRL